MSFTPATATLTFTPATATAPADSVLPLKILKHQANFCGSISLPELALMELEKLWVEDEDGDLQEGIAPRSKVTVQALLRTCIGHIQWEHYDELSRKVWYDIPTTVKGYLATLGALGMEVSSPAKIAFEMETVESVIGRELLAQIICETVVVSTACSATKQSATSQATKKVGSSAAAAKKKKGTSTNHNMSSGEDDQDEESFESFYSESSNNANDNDGESAASEISIVSKNISTVDRNPSDETYKGTMLGFEMGTHMCKQGYQTKKFHQVVMEAVRLAVQKVNLFVIYHHCLGYSKFCLLYRH